MVSKNRSQPLDAICKRKRKHKAEYKEKNQSLYTICFGEQRQKIEYASRKLGKTKAQIIRALIDVYLPNPE